YDKFREYLMQQVRYNSLYRQDPEAAEALFKEAEEDVRRRYNMFKRLAEVF
ncbi:MAG: pyruvate-flavodoxin oxidoreductase, partial [Firmicutes bacterium]|nr:pyruvate-flavodoxin oxidoreductase [Bacillota bacterium]